MASPLRLYALNAHAGWTCRHSGACCTAGWPIPVEPERRAVLGTALLEPDATGRCTFHDREAQRCRVHRDHGASMLPAACFHFPRRALLDDRGVFITLSHFCPTAAALLVQSPETLTVVESPAAFPATRPYDGLDARGAWPPLVKPDLLFDLESYSQWERFVLATLDAAPDETSVWDALLDLCLAAERLRAWTPGDGPFADYIPRLDRVTAKAGAGADVWRLYEDYATLDAHDRLLRCVPTELQVQAMAPAARRTFPRLRAGSPLPSRVARRYVAAKSFAAWTAYDGFGVRSMIAELVVAALVLDAETAGWLTRESANGGEARRQASSDAPATLSDAACIEIVRAADLLLVHLVDRPALLSWVRPIEHAPLERPPVA